MSEFEATAAAGQSGAWAVRVGPNEFRADGFVVDLNDGKGGRSELLFELLTVNKHHAAYFPPKVI